MAPIRSIDGRGGRRVLLAWIRANPNGRAVCDPACAPYEYAGVNWTFGDFAALGFAAQSLVTPVGAVTMV